MKTKIRLWIPATMLALSSLFLVTNCTKDDDVTKDATIPVLTTTEVTKVTQTTATSGGVITSDGGATVTERGVCWSTSQSPTIADNKTTDGTGAGSFTSAITGLAANTTYYVRAYATNNKGTGYGSAMSFKTEESTTNPNITEGTMKDIENNTYKTVTIGTQTWMVENLKVTKYNDGTAIPNVTDATAWTALTTGAYCDYSNSTANGTKYGHLYNWYTVNTEKLAPAGWHVPTDAEWTTLQNYLIANGYNYDATTTDNKIAKALAAKTDWNTSTTTGAIGNDLTLNNSTGFSALPGGLRGGAGSFGNLGDYGIWWSATEFSSGGAWSRNLCYSDTYLGSIDDGKQYGFSVRCVRD